MTMKKVCGFGYRPDGTTLHATLAAMRAYNKKFFDSQPWTVREYAAPAPLPKPASREELVEFLTNITKTISLDGNTGLLADIKKILDKEPAK
jgi:hypothetical protein